MCAIIAIHCVFNVLNVKHSIYLVERQEDNGQLSSSSSSVHWGDFPTPVFDAYLIEIFLLVLHPISVLNFFFLLVPKKICPRMNEITFWIQLNCYPRKELFHFFIFVYFFSAKNNENIVRRGEYLKINLYNYHHISAHTLLSSIMIIIV